MKTYRDAVAAVAAALGLALGAAAMGSLVLTDLYVQAAGAEARGEQALFEAVTPPRCDSAAAAPTRLALDEVRP